MTDLLIVRTGFILQGTTFAGWCRSEGVDPGYAYRVMTGDTNGPKSRALRTKIMAAAKRGTPSAIIT